MLERLMFGMMDPAMDAMMKNMLTKKYEENPFLMTTIMGKLSARSIIEAGMRAQSGQGLKRSFHSSEHRHLGNLKSYNNMSKVSI